MESEKAFRKRLASAENMAVRSRNYRRARERALTALARLHKEEYLALLEIEKEKDEKEGKRWDNLAHNLSNPGDNATHKQHKGRDTATKVSESEGNLE